MGETTVRFKAMTTAEIVAMDTTTLNAWHMRLDIARGAAIDELLAFARECYGFKQDCEAKQGGSTYTSSMETWFGIKAKDASMWATVGGHAAKFSVVTEKFPPSMETLYLLCSVPDNVIEAKVTQKTTQQEARKLKREHGPKASKPKKEKAFRIGWLKLLMGAGVGYVKASGEGLAKLRAEVKAKLGTEPPKYFTDRAEAQAFVDKVRPLWAAPPKVEEFTESQQKKLERAANAARAAEIRAVREAHPSIVEEELKKRLAPYVENYEKWTKEAQEEKELYQNLTADLRTFMTKDEYRLVLGCLHTDSRPSEKRLNDAFIIMKRVGKIFGE